MDYLIKNSKHLLHSHQLQNFFLLFPAVFVVAGINLSWGTCQFIYNILHLRRNLSMSVFAAVTNVFLAMVHIMLWFMVCTLSVGYMDDNESDVAKDDESLEKDRSLLEKSH